MTRKPRTLRTDAERALDDVALAARKLDRAKAAHDAAANAATAARKAYQNAAEVLAHARRHPAIPPHDPADGDLAELDGHVYPGGIRLTPPERPGYLPGHPAVGAPYTPEEVEQLRHRLTGSAAQDALADASLESDVVLTAAALREAHPPRNRDGDHGDPDDTPFALADEAQA